MTPLLLNNGKIYIELMPRPELVKPLRQITREHVESALILCAGNRGLAAKRLGMSLRTLMRWVEQFRSEDAADA